MSLNPLRVLPALQQAWAKEFPPLDGYYLDKDPAPAAAPKPPVRRAATNQQRFIREMTAIGKRARRGANLITGVILVWLAVLITTALLSDQSFVKVLSVGGASGGTVWCLALLRKQWHDLVVIEMVLAVAASDPEAVGPLIDQLRAHSTPAAPAAAVALASTAGP